MKPTTPLSQGGNLKSSIYLKVLKVVFLPCIIGVCLTGYLLLQPPYTPYEQKIRRTSLDVISLVNGTSEESWLALEGLRWKRGETDDGRELLMKRFKLLKDLLKTNTIKEAWKKELANLEPKGIVYTAGGAEQLTNAFASMMTLRRVTRCKLPIVVCHFGDEISERNKQFFHKHIEDLSFLDLSQVLFPSYHLPVFDGYAAPRSREDGYMVKILAIRAAPFKEMVFMDVDSFAIQSPRLLFDEPGYLEHGSMFWPDIWRGRTELWNFFNIEDQSPWYERGDLGVWRDKVNQFQSDAGWDIEKLKSVKVPARQAEAGQFLLNREKHWDVLEWLLFINMHHNITYNVPGTLGDKDTFRVAFALAGKKDDFVQVDKGPLGAFVDHWKHGDNETQPRFKSIGNVQLRPDGSMMFNHKTVEKIPAQGDPGHTVWPMDAVSTELSDTHGNIMLLGGNDWRNDGNGFQWGFQDWEVKYFVCRFNCTCDVAKMHKVENKCTGRSEEEKEIWELAWPATLVKVPDHHPARLMTMGQAEAISLIPWFGF